MNGIARTFNRLGTPDAVSWRQFWMALIVNAVTTFASGMDVDASMLQRFVVLLLSQIGVFAFLAAYRKVVLERPNPGRIRPFLTLVTFLVAGALRGLIAGGFLIAFAGASTEALRFRIGGGAIAAVVFLPLTAIIVSVVREYRRTREELLGRRTQLLATRERIVSISDQRTADLLDRLRGELADVLSYEEPADQADRLDRIASEVIRPMSHDLVRRSPSWNPPVQGKSTVRFRDVVDRATSDGPFLPVSTALIATLILTSYQWDQLAGAPALWLLMGSGVGWVCLFALNLAFRGAPAFLPPAARALAAPLCLVAVGVAVGAFLQWGTDGSGRMQSIFVGGPIYGAVGVTLALARAANRELRDSLDSLSQADVDFSRQIKRLRMQEWCTQRRVARALHGPVQAIIAASAGRLRSEQAAGFDRVRADLEAALQEETADDHATWSAGLARVKSTWRGLCDVRLDEDEAATALLDGDPLCAEIALEIVSEAVSNAIRHGKATEVRVTAMIEGSDVHLTVIDNGRGGAGAATGLGTQLLQDCALEWTRDESSFQSALHASLPMR